MTARQNKFEKYVANINSITWYLAMVYSIFLPLKLCTKLFYIGLFVFCIGFALLAKATYDFISTSSDQIIKKGIYRFSRHPMYLGTLLILLGSGVAAKSWLFILFFIIMMLCFYKEAIIEEKYCLTKYGKIYEEYLSDVKRWFGIPKMKSSIRD